MAWSEEFSHFGLLPAEIVNEIFDLISIREKKKARLVCERWRSIVDSQRSVVFRPKITKKASLEYLLNSNQHMDRVIFRNMNMRFSKKLTSQNDFPRIKTAELGWKNSQENIVRFLKGCNYTESLIITKFSLEKISRGAILKTLSEVEFNSLTRFKIIVAMVVKKQERSRTHLVNSIALLKCAQIPNLKEFDFEFIFRSGFTKKHKLRYRKLLLALYVFWGSHSKSMKILNGSIDTWNTGGFDIPSIPLDIRTALASNGKLDVFHFMFSGSGIRGMGNLVTADLLGSELKIFNLAVQPKPQRRWGRVIPIQPDFCDNIQEILDKNSNSIRNITLNLNVINLGWLQNCSSLQSFEIEIGSSRTDIQEPPGLDLSRIQLKTFKYNDSFYGNRSSIVKYAGILQMLVQSTNTLEHLELSRTPIQGLDMEPIEFWIRDYAALKTLRIDNICEKYIEKNMGGQYRHLTKFETRLESGSAATAWIVESMRNLEEIGIRSTKLSIHKILLTLPKLKRIVMFLPATWLNLLTPTIRYCQVTPGLKFDTIRGKSIWFSAMHLHTISVDRYTFVNP